MNALSYNTERAELHIPEYGRNIQNMINYAMQIESREERNKAALAIIDVMGQINPHLRDVEDYAHKLWTHLFIMSDFQLDVDSPYEKPQREKLAEPPKVMKYPNQKGRYGHFGYYSERMIEEATKVEDPEGKKYLAELLGNLLKRDYLTFHTKNVENSAIASHLKELSKGKLELENPSVLMSTNSILKEYGIKAAPTNQRRTTKRRKSRKRKN